MLATNKEEINKKSNHLFFIKTNEMVEMFVLQSMLFLISLGLNLFFYVVFGYEPIVKRFFQVNCGWLIFTFIFYFLTLTRNKSEN